MSPKQLWSAMLCGLGLLCQPMGFMFLGSPQGLAINVFGLALCATGFAIAVFAPDSYR